jgi:probable HAF family extracellular repeat protein
VIWLFNFMLPLGTLGGTNSYGEFINDLGQVSGHSETSNTANADTGCPPFDPFIWQYGKMTDINPGNFGGAQGGTNFLNNQGQAVGFGTLPGELVTHPFLWSKRKLTDLYYVGNFGGALNSAFNVSEKGHAVGVASTADGSQILAVLWRNGEFTNLTTLSGDDCSEPFRINSHDQIVGISFSCQTGAQHAFLWENGAMFDLTALIPGDSGLQLLSANWINEDGVIATQALQVATGATFGVLLFPNDESEAETEVVSSTTLTHTTSTEATINTRNVAVFSDETGRLKSQFLRPFSPAMLHNKSPN